MIAIDRPVRFDEVDAARIVFFARFLGYAHEAMESFFSGLEGGYQRLILERQIGLPAVDVKMKFSSPARYGDTLRIETTTARLGNRSAVLRYRMRQSGGGALVAEIEHTVVTTDLVRTVSIDMPEDVRAILSAHLETAGA
jgi:4-hydroxybenzoyl-CoA thioesterase